MVKKLKKEGFLIKFVNFPKKYKFLNKLVYLTLLLSNNSSIQKLNKKFRNKNKHTDILSFPSQMDFKKHKEIYLGDMIISIEYMNKPKNINHNQFKERVIKIFIHGFLHLLGFNHKKEKDFKKMLIEEEKIFKTIKKYVI